MRQKALLFGAAGALLLMASGCSRDSMPVPGAGTGRDIVFTVGGENSVEVKSVEASEAVCLPPLTLTSEDGTRSLTFERSVSRSSDAGVIEELMDGSVATKGAPVTSGNVDALYANSLYVTALRDDESEFMPRQPLVCSGRKDETWTKWNTAKTYVWPAEAELTFWGWSQIASPTVTNTTMTFPYVTPDSAGARTDAEAQNDVIVAKTTAKMTKDSGVSLVFAHAMSAIRFEIGKTNDCKVDSISLKNVMSEGNCTYTPAGSPRIAWSDLKTPKTFTQTFDTEIKECLVDDDEHFQEVDTTPNLVKTFMVIPQSSTASKKIAIALVITLKGEKQQPMTLTAELDGDLTGWQPGYTYTYRLSILNGLDIKVDDEVESNVKSDLEIKNIGREHAYLRALLYGCWVDKDGAVIANWDVNDTEIGTLVGLNSTVWKKEGGFYYFKYPLEPGSKVPDDMKLFTSYTLLNKPSFLSAEDHLEFTIVTQAVTAENRARTEIVKEATAVWNPSSDLTSFFSTDPVGTELN